MGSITGFESKKTLDQCEYAEMEEWVEGIGKDRASDSQTRSRIGTQTRNTSLEPVSASLPMYQTLVRPKHRVFETLVFDRLSESVSRDGRVELPVTDAEPH